MWSLSEVMQEVTNRTGPVVQDPRSANAQVATASPAVPGSATVVPLQSDAVIRSPLSNINWKLVGGVLLVAGLIYFVATRKNPITAVVKSVESVVK